jgi:hypothetical protein
VFNCKDGLGQPIVPGTKLLSMTSNGPRLYTVTTITWYADNSYSVVARDDRTRSRVSIKKLTRYLAFDPPKAEPDGSTTAVTEAQPARRVSHKIADALAAGGR